MEIRHLRYFVAVAEELNVTRAAARLRVAQPALSRQVRQLEEELGTNLFARGHSGVQLTRSGKAFYVRARKLLTDANEAVNEARVAGGVLSGRIVLGFPSGIHLNYLVPVIEQFQKDHPNVQFDFFHGLTDAQMKALRSSRVDIAFVNLPAPMEGLEHLLVWRVPFEVVLPRKHRLASRREFNLEDLRGEDFVFCTRDSRPEFYDDFFHHCTNAGFRPNVVKEVGGYPSNMLGLISVGAGISVLPHFAQAERIRGIVWRPLLKPKLWMDFALLWSEKTISSAGAEFVAAVGKTFGDISAARESH